MKSDKTKEYAIATADAIASLFKNDEEDGNPHYHFDLSTLDATAFFTGAFMGLNHIFNKFTGDEKNSLEFTHLCNRLIVQRMLKEK